MGSKLEKLEWAETYELGFPVIDDDHRRLCGLANAIIDALDTGRDGDCADLAAEFIEVLRGHFPKEEKFLTDIGYRWLAQHAHHHREMLAEAEAFAGMCRERPERDVLAASFAKLVAALRADIREGDLNFRTWLRDKGLDKAMIEERFGSIWL